MNSLIDLHTHSTASDGSHSPVELARLVKQAGLKAWSLTDHDNVDGQAEAQRTSRQLGLEYVPGLELSVEFPRPGWMHLLGYFVKYRNQSFLRVLEKLKQSRRDRNPRIAEKLRGLGLDITMEEVQAEAGGPGAQVGRPHFAAVLVAKGLVQSTQEAFDQYLAKGGPAYAEKQRLSPERAIRAIHRAKGLAVLAHPFSLMQEDAQLSGQLARLKELGLDGMEIHYPLHDPRFTRKLLRLAHENALFITGGSDFHGTAKPDIRLGTGRDHNLSVNHDLLKTMRTFH